MKRWALLTVFLYALVISFLVIPFTHFLGDGGQDDLYHIFLLAFLLVLAVVQAILLLVPVSVARERPVKRRTATVSAVAGAFLMAVLLGTMVWFVVNMVVGEDGYSGTWFDWGLPGLAIALWVFWGLIFHRGYSSNDPAALTSTLTRWLLRGSILEILIAVPAHILSRHRNECCMPGFTLAGLLTGISVAVMAFGPGLFFLFARKVREKTRARGP